MDCLALLFSARRSSTEADRVLDLLKTKGCFISVLYSSQKLEYQVAVSKVCSFACARVCAHTEHVDA